MPAEHTGRTPMSVMTELGVVERLMELHPGRLEWHAPWHADHTADALLRGRVDLAEVDAQLAELGVGWLTLNDNGALPSTARMTLAPEARPPRVYHLMPRGISKGLALAWDLRRRGVDPADAVAIGDSVSDLEMAPSVGRLWITANGAAVEGMAERLTAVPNASVTPSAMGEGWAEAVRASL
jgi:hydroxymethylpyrimidine pyrophosphatase-like HAD family hydrolase